MSFRLTSPSFEEGGEIPREHTCDGEDVSPALEWSGVPEGARSLALVVDDPDAPDPAAPKMTWVHWVLYDLPAAAAGLPRAAREEDLPSGTRRGLNDWKRPTYGGPCPPVGRHRYFHRLYALDVQLGDLGTPTRGALQEAIAGHVLDETHLMGTYERKR